MSFTSWPRNLRSLCRLGTTINRKGRRAARGEPAKHFRPQLEALELRCMPSFSPVAAYAVDASPVAIVSADLNNDGHLDLATANYDDGTVSVLLGDGQGGFGAASQFPIGAIPRSLAVADFNNDGNLDLVAANVGSDDLSVLLGNGDGTFRAAVQIATLPGPRAVASADFNADGNMDLVCTGSSVELLLGDGQGGFAARHLYDVSGGSLAVADLNADGRPDMVTTGGGFDGVVRVLLGNGDGTLRYAGAFATGPLPASVAIGDFTGDGVPDLATIGTWAFAVDVLPGRGDGTFAAPISSFAPVGVWLSAADFNGDGKLDVLATDDTYWSEFASLLLGRGDGTFDWPEFLDASGPTTVGDFNGDDYPDLAAAADYPGDYGQVSVFLNDGDWSVPPPPPPPTVRIGDMNVTEGNTDTTVVDFTVTLSTPSTETITIAYATSSGTAADDSDYQAASGTVTFAPGETSKTITVLINGDTSFEPDETFLVNLSNANGATIADGEAVGTIVDDDVPLLPEVRIDDVSMNEGRHGTTRFTFTVTLSAAYDLPVTLSFATSDGTAKTSDNDYVANSGTITFAPGQTMKTITVVVKGDKKKEASENFFVDLSDLSSYAVFLDSQGMGTIQNDD